MSAELERWAVALAAPIRRRLGLPLLGLAGGRAPSGRHGDRFCKQQLGDVASIRSRADLLAQLPVYLERGSREEYARYRRWHQQLPPEARSTGFFLLDQTERLKRVFVHDHIDRPEETSVAAWDVGRLVHYVGLGWGAGYLSEAEAWQAIGRAARIALDAYDSWPAYGRGFVYGRWFWAGYWADGMKETAEAIDELLAPGGGWHDLPWPVDVGALERVEEAPTLVASTSSWSWRAVRIFVDCPACALPILVRELGTDILCDGCGYFSELAARVGWLHAAAPDDEDDDDDEDEYEDDEEDADDEAPADPAALTLFTNLDDRIQRALKATPPHARCAGCGAAIEAEAVRAGDHRCGCGRVTPVVTAPTWLRAIDGRLRYVVGGPLTLGRPDGVLYLLAEEA
jgi:hypothetical protein